MVNYFSLASKNLRKRGIRSWLTLLGIFIGIVAVISLIILGNGLKTAVNAQFGVESTQLITIQAGGLNYGPPGSTAVTPLTKDDVEAIGKLSAVEFAAARNIEVVRAEFNDKVTTPFGVSIDEKLAQETYEILDLNAEKGKLLKSGDGRKVVLGNNLQYAEKNGFDKDIDIGNKILINDKKFIVKGILEKKGSFIFDNIILMLDDELNDLVGYGDDVGIIAVKVKDKDLMDKAKEDIEKLLRKRRDVKIGEENFEVSTPDAILEQVNSILSAIQIFIVLIASISIFVGAIGIVNTMATSVLERKKEIGIMKAIGAKNKHIFMQFLVESGMMGLTGGILGVFFGILIGYFGILGINSFIGLETKPEINLILIFLSLVGSFLTGAIAGIVPAMKAARQNPVEALRG